ncbi:MAG: 30S ribosomal protein S8e [Candidatus Lokiarchaeota archaeon]|nr:30S ribosomal protein S8e [Candidatus Harpocratesius repetitus]
MVNYQERSRRKPSGAKVKTAHKKRKARMGRNPIETHIADERKKIVRTRGGNIKIKAYSSNLVNVSDPDTKTTTRAKITRLEKNTASVDYQRRNIITKGAIVETELGKVRITSRPGQTGQINGILLKEE